MRYFGLLKTALWTAGILFVIGLAISLSAIGYVMWSFRPSPLYRFPVPPETLLTERTAIDFSKRALIAYGIDEPGMLTVPYNEAGKIFAANGIDPDRGYVIWSTPHGIFGVRVEKMEQEIVCQVFRNK